MGAAETIRLPAGWYPDPDGDDQRRWWNGREWTQYTAAFQRSTPIDEPAAVVEESPRRQNAGKRLGGWLAGAASIVPTVKRRRRRGAHRLER